MRGILDWGWETLVVFRAATVLALVHALDDAFVNRQPGVDLDQHALAAVIGLAVGIGALSRSLGSVRGFAPPLRSSSVCSPRRTGRCTSSISPRTGPPTAT